LREAGKRFFFDRDVSKLNDFSGGVSIDIGDLLEKCQWIFGCTGHDVFREMDIASSFMPNQQFISCSSEDKEFISVLKIMQDKIAYRDVFEDLTVNLKNDEKMHIHFGGFPINFSSPNESINPYDIQLTRGLLLSGIFQALHFLTLPHLGSLPNQVMLDPSLQVDVFTEWLKTTVNYGYLKDQADQLTSVSWITANSGGMHDKQRLFKQLLIETT